MPFPAILWNMAKEGPLLTSAPPASENGHLWAYLTSQACTTQMASVIEPLYVNHILCTVHTSPKWFSWLSELMSTDPIYFQILLRMSPCDLEGLCSLYLIEKRKAIPLLFMFRTPAGKHFLNWASRCLQDQEAAACWKPEVRIGRDSD